MSKGFMEDEIYPLTIIFDRYTGTYSGGQYTAWNLLAEDVPPEVDSDDIDCYEFWLTNEIVCGKGGTVSEALADLYIKLKEGDEEDESVYL